MSLLFTKFLSCIDPRPFDVDVEDCRGKSGSYLNRSMGTLSTNSLT